MKNIFFTATLILFTFSPFIVFSQPTKQCNSYLDQETKYIFDNFIPQGEYLLDAYKTCLRYNKDSLSIKKLSNLDFFDIISVSKDGLGGWGRNRADRKLYLIDQNFKAIKKLPEAFSYLPFEGNYSIFFGNDMMHGVINPKGSIVIPSVYNDIYLATADKWVVMSKTKWGIIDKNAKFTVPLIYDDAKLFNEGVIAVKKNGRYGFVDEHNKTTIPFTYESAGSFSDGVAPVKSAGKYGYIDKAGKIKIPFAYDEAMDFFHQSAGVKLDGKWGLIDLNGQLLSGYIFDGLRSLYNSELIQVYNNGKTGCISIKGEIILEPVYDEIGVMSNGFLRLYKDGAAMIYNTRNRSFCNNKYEIMGQFFYDGVAFFKRNGKYGFIDTTFKEIIPPEYELVNDVFLDGLARVKKDGMSGYINKKNEVVIPISFDIEYDHKAGVLLLRKKLSSYLFTTSGNLITELPKDFKVTDGFYNGLARFTKGLGYGFIDQEGKVIIEAKYEILPQYHTGKIPARLNKLWGCIDREGKVIVPFIYADEESARSHISN
ncbi:WG repeat-containing protein [Ferruginibacter sp. SUN106]|uniref:WG repeat-containing protein n=1 Tax=Ferruginibacter sp. SUN106 TaxID=2978348 RepID=UPI003D35A092